MDDFQWNWGAGPVKDDEFRWNWAKANVDPSYKIQGPGIGSLLRAIHPDTQADAIQQMNNNLATDRANIETIAKQGAAENDFVNKLYDEQAAAERTANALEGHRSSWMQNYSDAVAKGDKARIKLLEQQATELFGNNALDIIKEGQMVADKAKEQNYNYDKIMESLPSTDRKFDNPEQRTDAIALVNEAEKNGDITREQATKARSKINSIPDWTTINTNMSIQAHSQNRVNKSVENKNLKDKETWIKEYKAKYPGKSDAYYEERYKKAHKL